MTTGARLGYRLGEVRLGVASVIVTTTQTISGLISVSGSVTKTQNGNIRIRQTTTKTQSGTARIRATTIQTQSGTAHIQAAPTVKTISGNINIVGIILPPTIKPAILTYKLGSTVLGPYNNPAKEKTQLGNIRIQVTDTKTQSGNIRVTFKRSQTQSGSIFVLGQTTKIQLGNISIHAASSSKNQLGNIRIHPVTTTRLQFGNVNVHAATSSKTQLGNISVIGSGTRLKFQSGNINVQADSAPSSPGSLGSSLSGSCVVLTWTAATDLVSITSYQIWRAVTGFGFTLLATVPGSTLTYTDCSVGSGSYDYYVVAQNGAGLNGPASGTVTQVVTLTTTQTQSGTININGGRAQTILGNINVVSGTPTSEVRTTQMNTIARTHKEGAADGSGNSARVSQMATIATIQPDHTEVLVCQMCVIVRIPRMKRYCYAYSGDNVGLSSS